MYEAILKKYDPEFLKILEHNQEEFATLRTGRAKPALIENIVVEVYGSRMRIKELANITAPEPNVLIVKPWDVNNIKEIEKAIAVASLGLNPSEEGQLIRINLPDLTTERREQLIKVLHEKLEQGKISFRLLREKIREEILSLEKNSQISEDEKFAGLGKLDEKTKEFIIQTESLATEKGKEISGK